MFQVPLPRNHGRALRPLEVEVRTHFDGRWVGGFEIADVTDNRYLLRRHSDGAMLPVAFSAHDVRSRRPVHP
jgi:hypothetical protein